MQTGITLINLYNKALKLVGDYSLNSNSIANTTGLFLMVQSLTNEAVDYIFTELRSISNLRKVNFSTATLVGDYYELDLGSTQLYKQAYKLYINNRVGIDFTKTQEPQNVRIEFRTDITPPGKSFLVIHKDIIGSEPLSNVNFEYFFSPNTFINDFINTPLLMHPLAIEAVCYRMATTLAIQLNEDINLSQTYARLTEETLSRLKRTTSLTYGRHYFAKIG